jgi:hypothetical protein
MAAGGSRVAEKGKGQGAKRTARKTAGRKQYEKENGGK